MLGFILIKSKYLERISICNKIKLCELTWMLSTKSHWQLSAPNENKNQMYMYWNSKWRKIYCFDLATENYNRHCDIKSIIHPIKGNIETTIYKFVREQTKKDMRKVRIFMCFIMLRVAVARRRHNFSHAVLKPNDDNALDINVILF